MSNLGFFSENEALQIVSNVERRMETQRQLREAITELAGIGTEGYPPDHNWKEGSVPDTLRIACQEYIVTCEDCGQQFVKIWWTRSDTPDLMGLKDIEPCEEHRKNLLSPPAKPVSRAMTSREISDGVMRGLMVSPRCFE